MCNTTREAPSLAFTTDAVVMSASTEGASVAGADPSRRSVTIINDPDGTAAVYLLGTQTQRYSTGLKLKAGAAYTLNTVAPVYISAPGGGTVFVVCETGSRL